MNFADIANTNTMDPRALQAFKDQVLLVLLNRLGGEVVIRVDEVDDTARFIATLHCDQVQRTFTFHVGQKQ